MRLSSKDERAMGIIKKFAQHNMNILAVERRFEILPNSLQDSPKGRSLRKIFQKRDELEDKGIAENPRATDSKFVNLATNRRNIYAKAMLRHSEISERLIVELESLAWRNEHPIS